jgi:acyl transferase domain-containing protein/SAM-dependent methyltransferase/acyl carrier protein
VTARNDTAGQDEPADLPSNGPASASHDAGKRRRGPVGRPSGGPAAGPPDADERRRELLRRALTRQGLPTGPATGAPAGPRYPAPLSSAQRRMWFLHRLDPVDPAYHLTIGMRLTGDLDPAALRKAFETAARRQEILRTIYREEPDGTPVQHLAPDGAMVPFTATHQADAVQVIAPDAATVPFVAAGPQGTDVRAWAREPFDLTRDLPLRLLLVRRTAREHLLFLTIHHIACDDLSWEILLGEVSRAYRGDGTPPAAQYADYARWEAAREDPAEESRAYWRRVLADAGAPVRLPADQPRPARAPSGGVRRRCPVPGRVAEAVRRLARDERASPYMVLLAAAAWLLRDFGATGRVPIGTPVVRRPRPEFEPLAGNFGNVIVLPVDVRNSAGGFRGLVRHVQDVCTEAYAHQDVPFETVVEDVRRAGGGPRVFDVMFSHRSGLLRGLDLPGIACAEYPADVGTARFDLVLEVADDATGGAGMTVTVTARDDMFTASTTQRIADRFARLIEQLAERSEGTSPMSVPDAPEYDADLDIAIVAMEGRFPGAPTLDRFWDDLAAGREAATPFSDEEFLAAGHDPAALRDPGLVKVEAAVAGIDLFDADFFGYRPTEAELLDPQQRLFLECAYHALQQAGYSPREHPGAIGVYAGASQSRYFLSHVHPHLNGAANSMALLPATSGNSPGSFATRVSYELGLTGPSISVSTACSTSLVAVHLACRDLLDHQCDLALAGGASLNPVRKQGYQHVPGGPLSPDGRCRAFDAAADGMFPGDGIGVVVLKRLADALADGDPIRAVIKGSAVNNDGDRKVGFTAPSAPGQTEVILAAHAAAGIEADSISYVEAHGTATPVGDPIEMRALVDAFHGSGGCALGSVKTNIGHLDAAAGIAGLIKTVLALEHEALPPSLHFERPSPLIAFGPFRVTTELTPWPRTPGTPRRAGVSSFGIGGTNAHVVLQEAPPVRAAEPRADGPELVTLSAKSPAALAETAAALADHLDDHPGLDLRDVAHTLRTGREEFPHRRAVAARDARTAARLLRSAADRTAVARPVVFLLPGAGAQYGAMGAGLDSAPVRAELDRCAAVLGRDPGTWLDDGGGFPGLVAVSYAIARQLDAYGVRPVALLGHSLGEYTAACLAGVMSLEDALPLVAERERLFTIAGGATTSVLLAADALGEYLTGGLSLATVNGPLHCSVAGPVEEIEALERRLEAEGVDHNRLRVPTAVHSALLDPILHDYERALSRVTLREPRTPFVSNVTGTWITPEQATDPAYWLRHTRETVRFAAGLARIHAEHRPVFVEAGPGRGLTRLAGLQLGHEAVVVPAMRHPRDAHDDAEALMTALGAVWAAGGTIDRHAPYDEKPRRRVPLPGYAFQRRRYWLNPPAPAEERGGTYLVPGGLRDPAFGRALDLARRTGGRLLVTEPDGPLPAADPDEARRMEEDEELLRGRIRVERTPESLQRDLDRLCALYVLRFLRQAGVTGGPHAIEDVAAAVQVVPGYRPFLDAMLAMLATDGYLTYDEEGRVTIDGPADIAESRAAILAAHPGQAAELDLLDRCAAQYPDVFAGRREGHEVLLPDGSGDISQAAIDRRIGVSDVAVHTRLVAQAVARLARRGPLRVLEVGAGRGHLTWEVADALKGIPGVEYHFTDLGRSFVLAAQRTAASRGIDFMRFGVLDIAADPVPQGYPAGGFDVVLAFNVLHATPDLHETLGHVRTSLAPGGRLFLLEAARQRRPSMMTAGLFAGWWYFADDLREHSPLLAPGRWAGLLTGEGYADVRVHPHDPAVARDADHVLLTAQTPAAESARRVALLQEAGARVEVVSLEALGPVALKVLPDPAAAAPVPETPAGLFGGGSAFNRRPELTTPYAEPSTDLERTVAGTWQTVLGIDRVGVDDSFFDLGGESLLAMQLVTRLREELGVALSVRRFFDAGDPTVRGLVRVIEQAEAGPGPIPVSPRRRTAGRSTSR